MVLLRSVNIINRSINSYLKEIKIYRQIYEKQNVIIGDNTLKINQPHAEIWRENINIMLTNDQNYTNLMFYKINVHAKSLKLAVGTLEVPRNTKTVWMPPRCKILSNFCYNGEMRLPHSTAWSLEYNLG
jgi:hypothetical protein